MRTRSSPSRKSIFDPVHGVVTLSGPFLDLVGDPLFQRLWGIRQTGLAHLVFPGANHTRLEHSLGTYWVAKAMAQAIDLPAEDRDTVAAGGLLHDLGHAPFSHTLDGPLKECLGLSHEERSRAIVTGAMQRLGSYEGRIPRILRSHGIDPVDVADLIDPPRSRSRPSLMGALLHGAIDADRIDYLQRDAHYTGVAHGAIDAVRLLATVQDHKGRIAFAEKGRDAVEGFLVGRALMYSSVYYHKTVRAAEVMAEAAVTRLAGYPERAVPLLSGTDGDLLVGLEAAGGRSAELVRALRTRRLFRRVRAERRLSGSGRRIARALSRVPAARRSLEDRLSESVGAPEGAVVLDLSGLPEPSRRPPEPGVVVLEDGRPTSPFGGHLAWRTLAGRPRAPFELSVYADRRYEEALGRRLDRTGGALSA